MDTLLLGNFRVALVTLPSQFLRGRITRALYEMMNFRECVVASNEQYIDLAVRLATDPAQRNRVRERINATSPALFENPAGVRELEQFFLSAVRSDLCVSALSISLKHTHRGDAENTEEAQRISNRDITQ